MLVLLGLAILVLCAIKLSTRDDLSAGVLSIAWLAFCGLLAWTILRLLDIAPVSAAARDADGAVDLVFWSGLLGAALFGMRLWQMAKARSASAVRVAAGAAGIASGLLLCLLAADHWYFFRDGAETGWTSPVAIDAQDFTCSTALVRIEDLDAAYRCITGAAFNAMGERPFVPWPGYTSGRSVDLRHAIQNVPDRAVKVR